MHDQHTEAVVIGIDLSKYKFDMALFRNGKLKHKALRNDRHGHAVLVAMCYNPLVKAMKKRMLEAGRPKMAIAGAAMRKLVHLIYGVLKSGIRFDPNYQAKSA